MSGGRTLPRRWKEKLGRDLFLYGLSFLLLLEWLYPLPQISDTGYMSFIFSMTALFFFITFLQFPFSISVSLKALLILYGMCLIFSDGDFFSTDWLFPFIRDVIKNIVYMSNGHWLMLTDMFRTLLFFTLLAIMSYLLYYWTVQVRRIMFFLVCTVVYVTVLDTFFDYDATYAIIRTFTIGFLLLGLLTIYQRIEAEDATEKASFVPVRLAVLLVMMIGIGAVFGLFFPKFEPQWDDPVPYVKAAIGIQDGGEGSGVRKIGYGENDEQLGGGFLSDDTPVFYAAAVKDHYWRGETKNYYTGKGWESTTPFLEGLEPYADESGDVFEAEIVFADGDSRFSHLFYPGRLLAERSIMDVELSVDFYTAKARTFLNATPVALSHYYFEYSLPQFDVNELRAAPEDDPDYVREYYTQLPDTLPQRVYDLAEEIVKGYDNRYDRVKAVETFLSSTYKYETRDVPIPEEGQDYVDQFLFETKRGYCDNFSTAMIVLLRTQNIPARWAKGFTQGEKIEELDDGRYIYQVTNSNAHSWVEVYFPGAGWIPFEPTRGFNRVYDAVDVSADQWNVNVEREEKEKENSQKDRDQENEMLTNNAFFQQKWSWKLAFIIGLGLVLSLVLLLLKSKKVAYYVTWHRFQKCEDGESFVPAYEQLLWLLDRLGLGRKNGETLREYAQRIDSHYSTDIMKKLTSAYEEIAYGCKSAQHRWKIYKKDWQSFLERIKS